MSAAEAETSSEGRTGSCMRGSLDAKVANECTNSLHGVWGVQAPRPMHVCMHFMHVMHAYYACILCMHIMHACILCMNMHACILCILCMHACIVCMHACRACICMRMHAYACIRMHDTCKGTDGKLSPWLSPWRSPWRSPWLSPTFPDFLSCNLAEPSEGDARMVAKEHVIFHYNFSLIFHSFFIHNFSCLFLIFH